MWVKTNKDEITTSFIENVNIRFQIHSQTSSVKIISKLSQTRIGSPAKKGQETKTEKNTHANWKKKQTKENIQTNSKAKVEVNV